MNLAGGGIVVTNLSYVVAVEEDAHLTRDGGVDAHQGAVLLLDIVDAFSISHNINTLQVLMFQMAHDVQPLDLVEFGVLEQTAHDEARFAELNLGVDGVEHGETHGVAGKLVIVGPEHGVVVHHQQ